jgi:hypothetical protein
VSAAARFSGALLVLLVGLVLVLLFATRMAVFEFYGALLLAVAISGATYLALRRGTGAR